MTVGGFPLGWHPAKPSNFARRRGGLVPIAEVDHRMVGWLLGTRRYFTVSSERPVSTHFGIGHDARDEHGALRPLCPECGPLTGARGPLVIDQYVDLADMAFANGNWHPTGGWPLLQRSGGQVVNPNRYTYSIEHEDGATAGRGRVTPHVARASIELSLLLHRGNVTELRRAGVRIGDQAWHAAGDGPAIALALRRIPVHPERYVSHHRISGQLKPYCWEPWLADRGFSGDGVKDALLRRLGAPVPPAGAAAAVTFPAGVYHRAKVRGSTFVGYGDDLTTAGFTAWAAAPVKLDHGGTTTTWFRVLTGGYRGSWFYRYDDRLTWRPV